MNHKRSVEISPFPFLFGGTFIEGTARELSQEKPGDFPSFSEGLSLREYISVGRGRENPEFPFLFGGTFIEGSGNKDILRSQRKFPFLFGGTFIEGHVVGNFRIRHRVFPFLFGGTFIEGPFSFASWYRALMDFPSFSEGLSLRASFSRPAFSFTQYFPSFSEGLSLRGRVR